MRERFFNEAKKQLDLEHGKVSLPTVMALYNLFLYSSEAGIDRAGAFYRVSCSEMYKKLRLGSEFPTWVDKSDRSKREQYRRAVSRASWGLFCIERYVTATNLHMDTFTDSLAPLAYRHSCTSSLL